MYIIPMQNYLIKLNPNVSIKCIPVIFDMYNIHDTPGMYLFSGHIAINNRNIFILYFSFKR